MHHESGAIELTICVLVLMLWHNTVRAPGWLCSGETERSCQDWEVISGSGKLHGQLPRGPNSSHVMDDATLSNTKCELSVLNNDVTVKRVLCRMSGRGRSRGHGRSSRAMAEVEVQEDPHQDQEAVTMTLTTRTVNQTRWSLHYTMQGKHKVQRMTQ